MKPLLACSSHSEAHGLRQHCLSGAFIKKIIRRFNFLTMNTLIKCHILLASDVGLHCLSIYLPANL